jgi:predicted Zn-dependent peptidase
MALESTSSRAEQLARQLMVFGRPLPVSEIVAKVEAVEAASVTAAAERIIDSQLTFAALGPIGHIEDYERVSERLR